jgi:hypothetical protein
VLGRPEGHVVLIADAANCLPTRAARVHVAVARARRCFEFWSGWHRDMDRRQKLRGIRGSSLLRRRSECFSISVTVDTPTPRAT